MTHFAFRRSAKTAVLPRLSRASRTSPISRAVRSVFLQAVVPVAVGFSASASGQTAPSVNGAATPSSQAATTDTSAETTLPVVNVSGARASLPGDFAPTYGGGQVARGGNYGVLGKQQNIDMPFSMTSYTAKLIEDQQARTLGDVLENDPAVRMGFGFGNFSQLFVIRGFPLDGDDVSLNGLYGIVPRQLVATEALERIDVFKGTSAFVNGVTPDSSGIGGAVNLELKRADDKPLTSVTVEASGSGEVDTHVDVGRRFGSEGQFGIRVNQSVGDGDTSVDDEHRRNNLTAVSLDYRGDKFRLYGDFLYQRERVDQGRNVVYVTGDQVPTVPSATANYAQSWSYSDLEDTVGIVRGEYDFLPGWTAYATGGIHHGDEQGQYWAPSYNATTGTTAYRLGVPFKEDGSSAEAGVNGKFSTGPVTQAVNLGYSITRLETSSAYTLSGTQSTSLYDPVQVAFPPTLFSGGNYGDPGVTNRTLTRSVAVSDTLGLLNDRVLFTVGVRRQSLDVVGYDYTGAQDAYYNQSLNTPIFGLVVKPWQNVAFYANRSEALSQGGVAPSTALNANQTLAPYRARQAEAGVKYDTQRFGASLAVYEINQPSAYTDATTMIYGENGEERHRGVETSVFGEPLKGVRLIAGASYIDAKLEGTEGGLSDGNQPIGVPRYLFNLGAEYDVPLVPGMTVSARMVHTGPQYLDTANTLGVPSWNRFDLGARYKTVIYGRETTFRANVFNLANKAYWASAIGGYLSQGAPRTLLLSMTTNF